MESPRKLCFSLLRNNRLRLASGGENQFAGGRGCRCRCLATSLRTFRRPAKVMPITPTQAAYGVICYPLSVWRYSMKRRWVIAGTTCMALICTGIVVRTERKNRQLAKWAAVYRVRAEQGDAKSQFALGAMYYYGRG